MKKDIMIYDKNGTLLKEHDYLFDDPTDDYSVVTLEVYWDEWYLASKISCWRLEEFRLEAYNDGIKLVDFEKER